VSPRTEHAFRHTLQLPVNAPTSGDVAFTDDLEAALSGLQVIALPAMGFCGPSSQISGASMLSITGAGVEASRAAPVASRRGPVTVRCDHHRP